MNIPTDYYCVLWSPGVRRIVSFNGDPPPLDDQVVLFLRERANPDGIITARASLKVRQAIQISGGPFDGLVGIIQQPPNDKERVKMLLKLLNREVTVELPLQFVNSEWTV
jgi:transcription antitermination factor NusG